MNAWKRQNTDTGCWLHLFCPRIFFFLNLIPSIMLLISANRSHHTSQDSLPSPEPSESRTPCCVRQTEECWECPSLNPAVLLCSHSPGPPHRSRPRSLTGLENRKHMHGFLREGRVSEEVLDLSPVIQPSVAV